jgi:hypothetical protein
VVKAIDLERPVANLGGATSHGRSLLVESFRGALLYFSSGLYKTYNKVRLNDSTAHG